MIRLLLLSACLAGSGPISVTQKEDLPQKDPLRSARERQADHAAFVGEYVRNDGFVRESLTVSENGKCFREARGCRADINMQSGVLFVANRVLTLQWEPCVQPMPEAPTRFVAVSWGERRYLVAPEQILGFCRLVQEGYKPTYYPYYLRAGDAVKRVDNTLPNVPEPYHKYLHTPFTAKITTIEGQERFRINRGRKDGLSVGVILTHTTSEHRFKNETWLKVVSVSEETAMCTFHYGASRDIPVRPGADVWVVSD